MHVIYQYVYTLVNTAPYIKMLSTEMQPQVFLS